MAKNVILDIDKAAVLLDLVRHLQPPMSDEDGAMAIREAIYIAPLLENAIERAGYDPDDLDLPDIPFIPIGLGEE